MKPPPRFQEHKPEIVIFDLDKTMWPMEVDEISPPLTRLPSGNIMDADECIHRPYPQSTEILQYLHDRGYQVAVIHNSEGSTPTCFEKVRLTIETFGWDKYLNHEAIYPETKDKLIKRIREDSSFHFHKMIYFDDQASGIQEVQTLGVFSFRVVGGMTMSALQVGLDMYDIHM